MSEQTGLCFNLKANLLQKSKILNFEFCKQKIIQLFVTFQQ